MKRFHPDPAIIDGTMCHIGDEPAFAKCVEKQLQGPVLLKDMEAIDLEDVREHLLRIRGDAIHTVELLKQNNDIPVEISIEESRKFLEGEQREKFDEALNLFRYTEQYMDSVLEALRKNSE